MVDNSLSALLGGKLHELYFNTYTLCTLKRSVFILPAEEANPLLCYYLYNLDSAYIVLTAHWTLPTLELGVLDLLQAEMRLS